MKKVNLFKTVSLLSVALFLGGTGLSTDASAKTIKAKGAHVTKITESTNYKKSTYTKKAPKKGVAVYTSRFLTSYKTNKGTKIFYSTQKVRVHKSNGKTASYRYVTNKKGTVKGWIWAGRLTGKQGKVTKVSKKTTVAPTTNQKVANKTTIKKVTNPTKKSDDLYTITDAVSNKNYRGMKNVGTMRDKLNKLSSLLANHPHAWDKTIGYTMAYTAYIQAYGVYAGQIKTGILNGSDANVTVKNNLEQLNWAISSAKY